MTRTEQLLVDDEATAFWRDLTAAELVVEQGKGLVTTFSDPRDSSISDEELESFLASHDRYGRRICRLGQLWST